MPISSRSLEKDLGLATLKSLDVLSSRDIHPLALSEFDCDGLKGRRPGGAPTRDVFFPSSFLNLYTGLDPDGRKLSAEQLQH